MLAYIITPNTINLSINGRMRSVNSEQPNFDAVKEALKEDPVNIERVKELLDISTFVAEVSLGRVELNKNEVRLDGEPVHSVLADRLSQQFRAGFSVKPLANFLERMTNNPSQTARDELYIWLEHSNMPITEDGCFLAFKKVRDDYTSFFDHKTDNSIGAKPEIPREQVTNDRSVTCSRGLHFCSYAYLPFYYGDAGRVVVLKIDPADVVSIPEDYNNAKGRAWTYEIVGEVPENEAEFAFKKTPVVPMQKSVDEDYEYFHDDGYDYDYDDDRDEQQDDIVAQQDAAYVPPMSDDELERELCSAIAAVSLVINQEAAADDFDEDEDDDLNDEDDDLNDEDDDLNDICTTPYIYSHDEETLEDEDENDDLNGVCNWGETPNEGDETVLINGAVYKVDFIHKLVDRVGVKTASVLLGESADNVADLMS